METPARQLTREDVAAALNAQRATVEGLRQSGVSGEPLTDALIHVGNLTIALSLLVPGIAPEMQFAEQAVVVGQ